MADRVNLADLVPVAGGELVGSGNPILDDATHQSSKAGPGTLFMAFRGGTHDGHDFAVAAVAAGSPAVMVERRLSVAVSQLLVADCRKVAGPVAAAIHRHPSRVLRLVGVTGTNGKTTVTHLIEAICRRNEVPSGLIGTIETRVGDHHLPNPRTTPEAGDFQRTLATMARMGADVVAAEVSSHALELGRVAGTFFRVAAFTNIGQDHLDFHGDPESYYQAKASLFTPALAQLSVINVDDPIGERLAGETSLPVMTVGSQGELRAENVRTGLTGSSFRISLAGQSSEVRLKLGGDFNVGNALIAAGCAVQLGFDLDQIAGGLESLDRVAGRFERICDEPFTVIVDYAHTPEAITDVINAAGGDGRVIVVVGAGGDRDTAKRPLMGAAAGKAGLVVVTSDNPRSEDPESIIDQVVSGIPPAVEWVRCADRRQAIELALATASPGDVVLILGKGHETGQDIDGVVHPFDDRIVAGQVLAQRFGQ